MNKKKKTNKNELKELLLKRAYNIFEQVPRGGIIISELDKLVEEINKLK